MLAALPAPRDARGMWHSLSRNQRMTLGMIAITTVVVLVGFITMSRPSEYQVAFSNLKDEDAAAVVTKLKEAKIPYELGERGTIKVPAAQVQEVKLMVAAAGVVKAGGGAGFEIFAQPHFGLTEFAEKINYQRARRRAQPQHRPPGGCRGRQGPRHPPRAEPLRQPEEGADRRRRGPAQDRA